MKFKEGDDIERILFEDFRDSIEVFNPLVIEVVLPPEEYSVVREWLDKKLETATLIGEYIPMYEEFKIKMPYIGSFVFKLGKEKRVIFIY